MYICADQSVLSNRTFRYSASCVSMPLSGTHSSGHRTWHSLHPRSSLHGSQPTSFCSQIHKIFPICSKIVPSSHNAFVLDSIEKHAAFHVWAVCWPFNLAIFIYVSVQQVPCIYNIYAVAMLHVQLRAFYRPVDPAISVPLKDGTCRAGFAQWASLLSPCLITAFSGCRQDLSPTVTTSKN